MARTYERQQYRRIPGGQRDARHSSVISSPSSDSGARPDYGTLPTSFTGGGAAAAGEARGEGRHGTMTGGHRYAWRMGLAGATALGLMVAATKAISRRSAGFMERGGGLRNWALRTTTTNMAKVPCFKIRATNEYGEYDETARSAYGLDMVVEPFRATSITAVHSVEDESSTAVSDRFEWRLQYASHAGTIDEAVKDAWIYSGGSEATVTLDRPGTLYVLSVKNVDEDGKVISDVSIKVSCKYVRREIRDLTDDDREAFLDALQIWYTIPNDEGRVKYGAAFENYQRTTVLHNAQVDFFCYHIGLQFLTSHFAFDLSMERNLQMINPTVSLPIWDFMLDSSLLGHKWYNSVIFHEDWLGSAFGSPHNDFMLSEGRFANISAIYDPPLDDADASRTLKYPPAIHPYHDPYGRINAPNNYQDVPKLSRTSTFCGLTSHATISTAETFVACFEDSDTVVDWETCMENNVHGDLHGLLGGAFHCNVDMDAFSREHPEFSPSLLSFALEFMTFTFWPTNAFLPSENLCNTRCTSRSSPKKDEDGLRCGCTCLIDAFKISDDEVYSYMENFMRTAGEKFQGDLFIDFDEDAPYPYGFTQETGRLSDEESLLLMRYLVKIGCEPGGVGYLSTLASPLDPAFFLMHAIFNKALHLLWLSPRYNDAYDWEWEDGPCPGSGYTDELPFSEESLGLGTGTTFMTNERILEVMHPKNPDMPFVYEKFASWGTSSAKDWDPFLHTPS